MKNKIAMNQEAATLNLPEQDAVKLMDTINYLSHPDGLDNNPNYEFVKQSGTLLDIESVSISLDVYSRINDASNTASNIGKPTPTSVSKSQSWLASRILARYKKAPTFVNANSEGGIILEYHINEHLYIMIECFNDGDVICLVKQNGIRKTYELFSQSDIETLLTKILNGGKLR